MSKSLTLLNLFSRHLNGYGDEGNLLVLRKRAEWRGFTVRIIDFELGDNPALFEDADLIFGGDGHQSSQMALWPEVERIAESLLQRIESGVPALAIGASYQLFGEYLETLEGERLKGAGIFSAHTVLEEQRKTGNIVVLSSNFGEILGYENHSGKTTLHKGQEPLAQVISGFGNNGEDATEGARSGKALGTYLHGPLLPKNPQVADFLIAAALEQRFGEPVELALLPSPWLEQARGVAKSRPR
ncbi:MAG: glutamine amidotransferase [Coriobacteriales bacterium]|jgi:CobQ-like glutamine amidotransferase family enzyme|nr:glutamine amidotransferase [Coriobacteriales bacterium]